LNDRSTMDSPWKYPIPPIILDVISCAKRTYWSLEYSSGRSKAEANFLSYAADLAAKA
jgi:hypothetical protein